MNEETRIIFLIGIADLLIIFIRCFRTITDTVTRNVSLADILSCFSGLYGISRFCFEANVSYD